MNKRMRRTPRRIFGKRATEKTAGKNGEETTLYLQDKSRKAIVVGLGQRLIFNNPEKEKPKMIFENHKAIVDYFLGA